MRKIVRRVVEFECGKCKTRYTKAKDALECQEGPIEVIAFKKGDKVKIVSYRQICNHKQKEKDFLAKGRVIRRIGPQPMDYEYSNKWLQGQNLGWHVFIYVVAFKCLCGKAREAVLYSPELKKISQSLPIKGRHPGLDVLQKVFSKLY